jgi:hypothetical protein
MRIKDLTVGEQLGNIVHNYALANHPNLEGLIYAIKVIVAAAVEEEREAILRIVKGEEEHGEHNRIGEYACAARAIEGKIRARSVSSRTDGNLPK